MALGVDKPTRWMTGAHFGEVIGLASRKGFEPLTYGLGNRCSILLSYRDGVAALARRSPAFQAPRRAVVGQFEKGGCLLWRPTSLMIA